MIGGNIIIRSGLIFMGATPDDYLRAFDEKTGKESLDNLSAGFLKGVTPFYTPLCYEQKW
ncbi:hypothetical protein FEI17_21315 [Kosakonia radicincitans]|nr:hypothetical protein FEI17_21315 [Kosakonia radicincitans]